MAAVESSTHTHELNAVKAEILKADVSKAYLAIQEPIPKNMQAQTMALANKYSRGNDESNKNNLLGQVEGLEDDFKDDDFLPSVSREDKDGFISHVNHLINSGKADEVPAYIDQVIKDVGNSSSSNEDKEEIQGVLSDFSSTYFEPALKGADDQLGLDRLLEPTVDEAIRGFEMALEKDGFLSAIGDGDKDAFLAHIKDLSKSGKSDEIPAYIDTMIENLKNSDNPDADQAIAALETFSTDIKDAVEMEKSAEAAVAAKLGDALKAHQVGELRDTLIKDHQKLETFKGTMSDVRNILADADLDGFSAADVDRFTGHIEALFKTGQADQIDGYISDTIDRLETNDGEENNIGALDALKDVQQELAGVEGLPASFFDNIDFDTGVQIDSVISPAD